MKYLRFVDSVYIVCTGCNRDASASYLGVRYLAYKYYGKPLNGCLIPGPIDLRGIYDPH